MDVALVKQLTGQDTVTARALYKNAFEFQPSFKLAFSTNYLPKIREMDHGTWRRLAPIPFNASFTGENMDKGLRQKLNAEKAGILNWMVEGCMNWQQEGLGEPEAVLEAKGKYRADSDNIQQFIDQVTKAKLDAIVSKSDLYAAYKNWAKKEGEHYTAANREFSEVISKLNYIAEKRSNTSRNWSGIELQDRTLLSRM